MSDITTFIDTAAQTPASATTDGTSVAARPIAEMIAADRYIAANNAMSLKRRGLRFNRLSLPKQVHVHGSGQPEFFGDSCFF